MLVSTLTGAELGGGFAGLSTRYDVLFERYRQSIPVAYLRALAKKESSFDPDDQGGSYWGLLQVGPPVIESYNRRYGTSYVLADVLDPELNVQMATATLHRIIAAYGRHPSSNLQENWGNPEFVKLLTAGWNAGYSEAAGVGRVATYLETRGVDVTHDTIYAYAAQAGATRHLSNLAKRDWQRQVAALYFDELGTTGGGPPVARAPTQPRVAAAMLGLALLAGFGYIGWREGWFS